MPESGMFGWFDWRRFMCYPDAKRGAYARKSQKKRRLNQRRKGGKKK